MTTGNSSHVGNIIFAVGFPQWSSHANDLLIDPHILGAVCASILIALPVFVKESARTDPCMHVHVTSILRALVISSKYAAPIYVKSLMIELFPLCTWATVYLCMHPTQPALLLHSVNGQFFFLFFYKCIIYTYVIHIHHTVFKALASLDQHLANDLRPTIFLRSPAHLPRLVVHQSPTLAS